MLRYSRSHFSINRQFWLKIRLLGKIFTSVLFLQCFDTVEWVTACKQLGVSLLMVTFE